MIDKLLLEDVGLPHVLDLAVHLVNIFGRMSQGGHSCYFGVSPSPFGLDFGTLDFGLWDFGLGLDNKLLLNHVGLPHVLDLAMHLVIFWPGWAKVIILRQFHY